MTAPKYFLGLFSDREVAMQKRAMYVEDQKLVRQLYYDLEAEFPDKSTAFLLEMTCIRSRAHHLGCEIDHSDVILALSSTK